MKSLYLLTESDFDNLIYEAIVEQLTGDHYEPVCRRMRKGSGLHAVRASVRLALSEVRRMEKGSGVCFVVAMDNDRAPNERAGDCLAESERARLADVDRAKSDRYLSLLNTMIDQFGDNVSQYQVPMAIAVPVEMIEAWLFLVARGGIATDLPRFSRQESSLAKKFYHPASPPPQLKDQCEQAQQSDGYQSFDEWGLDLICDRLDADDLARRSPSFALFKEWIDRWPKEGSAAVR